MKRRRWEWIRLKGDIAVYAHCKKCDFYYPAYKNIEPQGLKMRPDVNALYPYCPYCGKKMWNPKDNINYREYDFESETWKNRVFGEKVHF